MNVRFMLSCLSFYIRVKWMVRVMNTRSLSVSAGPMAYYRIQIFSLREAEVLLSKDFQYGRYIRFLAIDVSELLQY
jgi:hypothetical protein